MSDLTVPVPQRGFATWRWVLVVVVTVSAALVTLAGVLSERLRQDRQPTVYHHADGHYSLNREDGPAVKLEYIGRYLKSFKRMGTMRLVGYANHPVEEWTPLFFTTGEAGLGAYELVVSDGSFECHIPGSEGSRCIIQTPQIIDLRGPDPPQLESSYPDDSEVVILVDESTTCEEVVEAATPHVRVGKSIVVYGSQCFLYHHKPTGPSSPEKWVRRPPPWWEDHVQPQLDRLRKLF